LTRWSNIAAVSGFVIVLAFVAERLLRVRTLWTDLSWIDLRDLGHDLGGFGLFILMNAAILLAIIVIFWGGYLWWREIRPKQPKDKFAEPQYSFGVRMRHVVELAVLSVVLGMAAGMDSKMQSPGWWVAGRLYKPGRDLSLGLFMGSAIVVDSSICFVILWGGYLQWMWYRHRRTR
jgi:hypothetical protein